MAIGSYVLVTPARNEAAFIERTLQSVLSQKHRPTRWVIVSDGSTDRTDDIVAEYSKDQPLITLVRTPGDVKRNFGSQVRAINTGLEHMGGTEYQYCGNLDADVSFPANYFQVLITRMDARPRLGLAGGYIHEEREGQFQARPGNRTTSVAHAVQLFRKVCFADIGGYVPLKYGGPDWHAEVSARMRGWDVEAFVDLPVNHHKPTLTAEGKLKGGFRQGMMDYSLGSSGLFELLKCLSRYRTSPYFLYSLCRYVGFAQGFLIREERQVSDEFIRFLKREQSKKITDAFRSLLRH